MKRIRYLTLLWMLFSVLVTRAQFNPDNPSEPGQLTTKLTLKVRPTGAGSTSGGGNILPGTEVTVTAHASTGWEFVNWTNENGEEVSSSSSYTFTKANKSETLTANFAFDPSAPSEPGELPYKLTLLKSEGGSVSGGGFYLSGTTVNIHANPNSGYDFEGWYETDGTLYSANAETTCTMGYGPETLIARFQFNPDSPSEPDEVNIWRLKLEAGDGGTVSPKTSHLKEGESVTIYASANSGYVFVGWYQGDTMVSSDASFEYTMGYGNVTLEARFQFQPGDPSEPGRILPRKFSFLLENTVSKPGVTALFPILLSTQATLKDMTFQLNFDPRLNIDLENVTVGETTTPYELTREPITSGETYDEGYTSYRFTLTGGSIVHGESETPTVTPILTFPFIIPADIETGVSYRVTINQISMTNEDGSTQTAGTRNGLLTVYKNGDSNGDNDVDIFDVTNVVSNVLGNETPVFIREVSDVNGDDDIDIFDVTGIVTIILND